MAERGTHHPERAVEAHVDDRVPLLVGHLGDGGRAAEACVVDDDVDMAEGIDGCRPQGVDVGLRRDVAERRGRASAGLGFEAVGGLVQAALVDVADHHRGALLGAAACCGEADAGAGRRRDDDVLAVEERGPRG